MFALADRITVLVYGRDHRLRDAPTPIRADAEVRRAYLGEEDAVRHGPTPPLIDVRILHRDLLWIEPESCS